MNRYVSPDGLEEVVQAFNSDTIVVAIDKILPVRTIGKTVKASHKYRQIASSITEIGLVEPPAVWRDAQNGGSYLLLDGHLRIEALKDLGHTEVECLLSTDDEAVTYNKRISRLSAVQEQRMIAKAIERNVPREKIAKALDINVRSLRRKATLIDGICEEAVNLLKDK
ncbi:MAG TPA: plasmid partitioning protein RepB C-terminal domain-containing protein, partial [Blastocatellia bacterium]|nr:plasmid partitioning protein RepB C-terminal domain-containing protein [Blastocatellia bacterium]